MEEIKRNASMAELVTVGDDDGNLGGVGAHAVGGGE